MSHYDVIVLGGGPGGYIAAERLGQAGRNVLLIEAAALGGTCLNVGCIPTKSLLNSAKLYAHALQSEQFGVTASGVRIDWGQAQAWKAKVVKTLVAGVGGALKRAGVSVVKEFGHLDGPGRVSAGGDAHTADHVIIATGSEPVWPPIPGVQDNPKVVDSTGLLAIDSLPERLVVIGGGVIGVEFASLFAMLGAKVDVVELLPEVLPFMDAELASKLRPAVPGVTFHLGCRVTEVEGAAVKYTDAQGQRQSLPADVVLMAVGRRPRLTGWGAEQAGLETSRTGLVVDDAMRTNLPNVWAVGDVTGRSLLAHAAYRMGEVAAARIIDPDAARQGQVFRARTVPWAVYSAPEAAGVGLTEAQARDQAEDRADAVVTATVPLAMSGRFVAEHGVKAPGAVKLVADGATGRILGVHILGPSAPEMIWGAAAALELELSAADLRQIVFPHPTVSEGIREAAWSLPI